RRIPTLLWPDGSFLVEPTDDELRTHLDGEGRPGAGACRPVAPAPASRAHTPPSTRSVSPVM
ncbi:hypothetical protein ONA70_35835, partial [Micromonospora yasonensis]|nr:hypothetical protein [Micromonospora yasonensis]